MNIHDVGNKDGIPTNSPTTATVTPWPIWPARPARYEEGNLVLNPEISHGKKHGDPGHHVHCKTEDKQYIHVPDIYGYII